VLFRSELLDACEEIRTLISLEGVVRTE